MIRKRARVLSLGELRETWDYVWIERRRYGSGERITRGLMRWILSALLVFDIKGRDSIVASVSEYGVTMRCWAVLPTAEEMNLTPWI